MTKKITFTIAICFLFLHITKAQQTLSETLSLNKVVREYTVYVPARYDGSEPVPLMFNFHGYTGRANGHMNSTRMQPIADTAGFILVYPQGSLFNNSTHWNVGSWAKGSTADDIGFTEAMGLILCHKFFGSNSFYFFE